MMTKFVKLFVISFLFVGSSALAGNTGFVDGQVTLTPSSITEGEEVEISVSFINQEEKTLTGKISFYDGNILLGSRELSLDSGQTGEFIITWTASLGEHSFVAKAENLKLSGSSVAILGPDTEPKEILIGFKNSSVAERLRDQGKFGAIVAGVFDEAQQFFIPIIQSIDEWRISKIEPLEITKQRIDAEKETIEEGKVKPILVVHSIVLFILIFIVSKKVVFFSAFCFVLLFILVRIFRLFKRIIRKDYSQE